MMFDRKAIRSEAGACLGDSHPAGELVDCVAGNFPDVEVYRENEDLVVKGGTRFLVIRREGPDRFRVAENITVPSTNLVEFGGGTVRTLDELIDDLATLSR